jgi:antitoxin YefM
MAKRAKHASPKVARKNRKVEARRRSKFIVISKQEYEGLKETIYLLSNPANASRLLSAVADADAGKFVEGELIEE